MSAMSDADLSALGLEPFDTSSYVCPRCGQTVSDDYYGPCAECRTALRAAHAGAAREVAATEYEPKMNVTPNAVASKD